MIDPGSAFFNRSRAVVTDFLQSAVIVDDRISIGPIMSTVEEDLDREEKVLTSDDREEADGVEAPLTPKNPIDGRVLIDAFAQKGIVCGLVKPDKEELKELPEQLRGIMIAADIVIIDWFLHSEPEGAKSLVAGLIKDAISSEPHRPRYIVIYSGNPKLGTITEQLEERIRKEIPHVRLETAPFEITCGSCRIVVLAKGGTLGEAARSVSERELADRIVEDFAQTYCGLVSNVALEAMSSIRRNAHRVLGRMTRHLDGAFLTHRALSPEPDDAQYDLRSIVVEEIEAALEDESVCDQASFAAISEWLEAGGMPETPHVIHFGEQQIVVPIHTTADMQRLMMDGIEAYIDTCASLSNKDKDKARRTAERTNLSSALGVDEPMHLPDDAFAVLCTLKPRYTNEAPVLTLGTVVKRRLLKGYEYHVCVQPRCDAVLRDGQPRPFLFVPLREEAVNGFCTVIPSGETFVRLLRSRSPYELQVLTFEPTKAGDSTINARRDRWGFYFRATGTHFRTLRWCGQLKDSHAQSVAQRVSSRLARVGLNTSMWLHRSTGKQVRDQ